MSMSKSQCGLASFYLLQKSRIQIKFDKNSFFYNVFVSFFKASIKVPVLVSHVLNTVTV